MVRRLVRQIPHNHPWQDRLVGLMYAIRQLTQPNRPDADRIEQNWGYRFWSELSIFAAEMQERWDQGPWEEREGPDLCSSGMYP